MPEPSNFKVILVKQRHLPTNVLDFVFEHCDSAEELNEALANNRNCVRIVVCKSDDIEDMKEYLSIHQIDTLFLFHTGNSHVTFAAPWYHVTTQVTSQRMLMIKLYSKVGSHFYAKAFQHQQNGENTLVNLYIEDSRRALNYAKTFI